MTESQFFVQFSRDLPVARPATRAGLRLGSIILLAVGALLVLGGVVVAIVVVARGSWQPGDVVVIPAALLGALLGYVGLVGFRRAGTAPADELSLRAPFAFAITPTTIEFPGTRTTSSETWDRTATRVAVRGSGVLSRIELTCAGKRSRNYLVSVLDGDPKQIVELVQTGPIGS